MTNYDILPATSIGSAIHMPIHVYSLINKPPVDSGERKELFLGTDLFPPKKGRVGTATGERLNLLTEEYVRWTNICG